MNYGISMNEDVLEISAEFDAFKRIYGAKTIILSILRQNPDFAR